MAVVSIPECIGFRQNLQETIRSTPRGWGFAVNPQINHHLSRLCYWDGILTSPLSLPSFVWLRREGVGRNRLGALFGTPEQQHGTSEICSWLTAVAKSFEFFTKFYLSSEHYSTLFIAPSSASGDCGGSGSSCSAEEIATWGHGEILVGGWPTPLKNMKVSWDHYSQYMESHKIHLPNHQPEYVCCLAIVSPANIKTPHPDPMFSSGKTISRHPSNTSSRKKTWP